jgi:ribonuclease VapC
VIAVDSSALLEIALDGPEAEGCAGVLEAEAEALISAGTLAEALVVADRRGVGAEVRTLVSGLGMRVVPVTAADAERVAEAYTRWGKGVHPAGLNLGDCFAYALARRDGCPLLFVGDDFARTDVPACGR